MVATKSNTFAIWLLTETVSRPLRPLSYPRQDPCSVNRLGLKVALSRSAIGQYRTSLPCQSSQLHVSREPKLIPKYPNKN